jgi:hypothetical protein
LHKHAHINRFSLYFKSNHDDRQRREQKGSVLYEHAVRCNGVMDAMGDEQRLLATNLISIGGILNEFTYKLFEQMGWKAEVSHVTNTTPDDVKHAGKKDRYTQRKVRPAATADQDFERYVMVLIFSQRLLGTLDFDDYESPTSTFSEQIEIALDCFVSFFGRDLSPNRVLFFMPVEATKREQEI